MIVEELRNEFKLKRCVVIEIRKPPHHCLPAGSVPNSEPEGVVTSVDEASNLIGCVIAGLRKSCS